MPVRLQKFIADCQVASRRKAEELIASGQITVNGRVVTELGTKIEPGEDEVLYKGTPLKPAEEKVYVMLHKPDGYITAAVDQFGRPAVTELVNDVEARLFPVGRLDYDTSGLLLMTNDGELTYKLTHPKHMVEKVYVARVKGKPSPGDLKRFTDGLEIDGVKTAPAKIKIVKEWEEAGHTSLKITIHEGRNRQVRKMLDIIGMKVVTLKRVATGRLFLGDLPKGKYRFLTREEVKYLKSL